MGWKKGEAPWEKQAAQADTPTSFKKGEAPWEVSAPNEEVVQQMPEWISNKHRAAIKNLGIEDQLGAQIKYLEMKYPGKLFKLQDGEILAKATPNEPWMALDPKPGLFARKQEGATNNFMPTRGQVNKTPAEMEDLYEAGRDLTDVAYDIPAGIAQGAATTAGALYGNLPGAAAASGASGGALEALRQKLGQEVGIPQDMDWGKVGTTTAIGTTTPLLFGAGKVGEKQVDGLVQKGWNVAKNKVFPYIGQKTSGIKADTIRAYAKNMSTVDELGEKGVTTYLDDVTNKVNSAIEGGKKDAAKELRAALTQDGVQVDLTKAKSAYVDLIKQKQATARTNADFDELNKLRADFDQYFGTPDGASIPSQSSGVEAFDLQQKLKQAAKYETDMTPATVTSKSAARGAYAGVNEDLAKATNSMSQKGKDKYSDWISIENDLAPKFEDAQKTYNTITSLDTKNKLALREKLQKLSHEGKLNLDDEINVLQAYRVFADPSTPIKPNTPLAYGMGALGGMAGWKMGTGAIGAGAGLAVGSGIGYSLSSPTAIKNYIKAGKVAEKYADKLTPYKAMPALMNQGWHLMTPEEQAEAQEYLQNK